MIDERDGGFRVAGPEEVGVHLDRMAAAIDAAVGDRISVVGIRRRGVPLARELADRLGRRRDGEVACSELTLKRYADDLTLLHEQPRLQEPPELQVEGSTAILVDDVLYSGRTVLRALGEVVASGAARVRVAVLASRGPNDVPVRADWVALRLDVGDDNVIEVHAPPYEERLEVVLRRREDL